MTVKSGKRGSVDATYPVAIDTEILRPDMKERDVSSGYRINTRLVPITAVFIQIDGAMVPLLHESA
jgi:hypothetical protein